MSFCVDLHTSRARGLGALARLRRSVFLPCLTLASILVPCVPRPAAADSVTPLLAAFGTEVQQGQTDLGVTVGTGGSDKGPLVGANVEPATGTFHSSIAFELPSARGSVQPSLSLDYSSSGGWGVGGMGWSLSVPAIERHDLSGAPQYQNDPAPNARMNPQTQDRFTYAGQPLVPVCFIPDDLPRCLQNGNRGAYPQETLPTFVTNGWHYYRLETDHGENFRFFWSGDHQSWIVQEPSGATMEFGVPQDDAADATGTEPDAAASVNAKVPAVFRWNLVRQYDAQRFGSNQKTNMIVYVWRQYQSDWGPSAHYLSEIYDTPPVGPSSPALATFAHHVHLDYTAGPTRVMEQRNVSPAWRVRPGMLLSGVDVSSMTWAATGSREQIRRYLLSYGNPNTSTPPVINPSFVTLTHVQVEGSCQPPHAPITEDPTSFTLPPEPSGGTNCPAFQPTTFGYAMQPMTSEELSFIVPAGYFPNILDFNADGLPDFLVPGATDAMGTYVPPTIYLNAPSYSSGPGDWTSAISYTAGVPQPSDYENSTPPANYNAGAFAESSAISVMWMGGFDPTEYVTAAPTVTMTLWTPTTAPGAPGWTWSSRAQSPIPWWVNQTPAGILYLQKYGNVDVDGDGLTDLLAGVTRYVPPIKGNPPVTTALSLTTLFSKRAPSGAVSAFVVPSNWPTVQNGCVSGTTNTGILFGGLAPGADPCTDENPNCNAGPDSPLNDFADINGDGLPDWIQNTSTGSTSALAVSFGNGDGTFGTCPRTSPACTCGQRTSVNLNVPQVSLTFYHLHDLDGDGLDDLIIPQSYGFDFYPNTGALGFSETPLQVKVATTLGFVGPGLPANFTFAFADMDGSGADDVVIVDNARNLPPGGTAGAGMPAPVGYADIAGIRPGLLSSITDGETGLVTSISYESSPALARAGFKGLAWSYATPQPLHAVTHVNVSESPKAPALSVFAPPRDTYYNYTNPYFDGRDQQFVGFGRVDTYAQGDSTEPTSHVATTYYPAFCNDVGPTAGYPACPTTPNYPNHAARGLPILSVTDSAGYPGVGGAPSATTPLTTVHHSYAGTVTYPGLDGRNVQRVYESATDTYLNDLVTPGTSIQTTAPYDVTIEGLTSGAPMGFVTYANAIHTLQTRTIDAYGFSAFVTDHGVASGAEGTISSIVTSAPVPADTAGYWTWRTTDTNDFGAAGGPLASGPARLFHYDFDAYGDLLDVTTPLKGTLPLARASGGAAAPPIHSSDGTVTLSSFTYYQDGSGNLKESTQPGTSGCEDYFYDPAYAQLLTARFTYLHGCGTSYTAASVASYERGLEVPLDATADDGERTVTTVDGFGRLLTLQPPSTTVPGQVLGATVTMT